MNKINQFSAILIGIIIFCGVIIKLNERKRERALLSPIRDGIYISNWETSVNHHLLKKYNIKTIICINYERKKTQKELINYQNFGIAHYYFSLPDKPNAPIKLILPTTNKIIQSGLANGNVLVHCTAGISRSVTVVCYYLMKKYNLEPVQALDIIKRNRPIANPNIGFVSQLTQI